jgi:hypothetical protein
VAVDERQGMSLGAYDVLGELGSNGAGTVHAALDRDCGHQVAIEILDARLAADPRVRERLAALVELRPSHHPHVAAIKETGESAEGRPYIVMEPVAGRPLSKVIAEQAPLGADDAVAILLQIVLGVEHLHEQGLSPLGLTPENILVGREGHVTLMPASLLPPSASAEDYRAPEEIDAEPAGRQADVYRLGLIAYELSAGRRPFVGRGEELRDEQLHAAPPPLLRFNPEVSGPAMRAIQRALAKKPDARPAGAAAFADLLLGGEPDPVQVNSEPDGVESGPAHESAMALEPARDPIFIEPAVLASDRRPSRSIFWRARWLSLAIVLVAAAAIATVLVVRVRNHTSAASVQTTAAAVTAVASTTSSPAQRPGSAAAVAAVAGTPALASLPTISELAVCSDVFACKQTGFVAGHSIAVCFVIAPATGNLSLVAAITAARDQPADANAPAVIARSAPIAGDQQRSCYQIVPAAPLAPGAYTAWVLEGSQVLGQRDFTTVAP